MLDTRYYGGQILDVGLGRFFFLLFCVVLRCGVGWGYTREWSEVEMARSFVCDRELQVSGR